MKIYLIFIFVIFFLSSAVYSQTAEVISQNANLRGTPSTKGKVVEVLSSGSSIEVIKQSGVWFLVQSSDYVGWIHGDTITLTSNTSKSLLTPIYTTPPPRQSPTPTRRTTPSRSYIRGPRGGCYYLSGSGKKVYVDRSLCN